ncbi:MAG: hypothetical protein QOK11_34 [Pseudonocardiales bacterium]|nr:hypothetical protein [Pseudonocardiales bacterium]
MLLAAVAMALVPSAPSVAAPSVAAPSVAAPSAPSVGAPFGTRLLFRLADPRINEASGIAAGITSPGVVYVHNDSGDAPRFFALDARTGATLAVYTVPGAAALDWEDIAVAPDARGVPSVWLGDIGDNNGVRREIQVYRVDEPRVDPTRRDVAVPSSPAEVWRLRYPDGAVDAESLAVAPDGTPYVVTKSLLGSSTVFAAPRQARAGRIQQLRRLGSIQFALTSTPGPFSLAGHLMATGADVSRDGSLLTVRTYTDAYLWRLRGGDVAAGLRRAPVRVALPEQPQGEGIAIAGSRLLVDSERAGSAVYAVPIPATLRTSAPPAGAPPETRAPASAPVLSAAPPVSSAARTRRAAGTGRLLWLGGAVVIAGGAATLWIARRRRSGRAAARPR